MDQTHEGMDRTATKKFLLHSSFQFDGCYEDAIKLSTSFPTVDFSGELFEVRLPILIKIRFFLKMKDQGIFSANHATFQHFIVDNWIIERLLPNGSIAYYGVDVDDCSFLAKETWCKAVNKRFIYN